RLGLLVGRADGTFANRQLIAAAFERHRVGVFVQKFEPNLVPIEIPGRIEVWCQENNIDRIIAQHLHIISRIRIGPRIGPPTPYLSRSSGSSVDWTPGAGSACRGTSFHSPFSRRNTNVTRSE